MSVSFEILRNRGLVYVRYSGEARIMDSMAAFVDYMRHPDYTPGQKQLVDLAGVTSFETDYVKTLKLQLFKSEGLMSPGVETILVYHAPDAQTFQMARLAMNAWGGVPGIVTRLADREEAAMQMLGQPEISFADMLVNARAEEQQVRLH